MSNAGLLHNFFNCFDTLHVIMCKVSAACPHSHFKGDNSKLKTSPWRERWRVFLEDNVEDLQANFLLMNVDVSCIQYMLTQFMWMVGVDADPKAQVAINTILRPKGTPVLLADPFLSTVSS